MNMLFSSFMPNKIELSDYNIDCLGQYNGKLERTM